MKKIYVPIIVLLFLSVITFVVFTKANNYFYPKEEALAIGEEKYLQFLWMIDGAFNSEREDGDFIVNHKKLPEDKKIFKCTYKTKKDKECVGENFETEFDKLFSIKLNYSNVYSDGAIFSWYRYENGKYFFNNLDSCNINRMPLEHQIEVISSKEDKLEYKVKFKNRLSGITNEKSFILVKERDEWKIRTAFYYDLCEVKYYIY